MTSKILAPEIYRQRLVVEGYCKDKISAKMISDYLSELGEELGMKVLLEPMTHKSSKYGWAGWVHWESSGTHVYAWDEPTPFITCDIYTCKRFDVLKAVEFTKEFFGMVEVSFRKV